MPKVLGGGKRVTNRWNQNGPEGKALIDCFTQDRFDINNHEPIDVHAHKSEFKKFDVSQVKAAIRRLHLAYVKILAITGSMEGPTTAHGEDPPKNKKQTKKRVGADHDLVLQLPFYRTQMEDYKGNLRESIKVQLPSGTKKEDFFYKIINQGYALEIKINDPVSMQSVECHRFLFNRFQATSMDSIRMVSFARNIKNTIENNGFNDNRIQRKMLITFDHQMEEHPYQDGNIPAVLFPCIGGCHMFVIEVIKARQDYNLLQEP